jgi:hypothetical protein
METEDLAAIAQQIMDLQAQIAVQGSVICLLAGKLGLSPDHIKAVMERLVLAQKEKRLLEIGDTQPRLAQLLGYENVAQELRDALGKRPPASS